MEFLKPANKVFELMAINEIRAIATQEMSASNRVAFEKDNQPRDTIKIRVPNQYKTK